MKSKVEIVEGLKKCTTTDGMVSNCGQCAYYNMDRCAIHLMKDALELIEIGNKPRVPESWKESVMQSFMKGE